MLDANQDEDEGDNDEFHSDPNFVYDGNLFECFQTEKGLHFIYVNARSLRHKTSELAIVAEKSEAAVIAVSETWFDDSMTDSEVSIPGYNV